MLIWTLTVLVLSFCSSVTLPALAAAGPVLGAPQHGREAAGNYRHVAGSACCHPDADPRPVSGPDVCGQRCASRSQCDAFVLSPSSGLCFLVRFAERGPDGGPLATPSRPAADRVLGLVQRQGPAGAPPATPRAGGPGGQQQPHGGEAQGGERADEEAGRAGDGGQGPWVIIEDDCEDCQTDDGDDEEQDWEEALRHQFGLGGDGWWYGGENKAQFEHCHTDSDGESPDDFRCFDDWQWDDFFKDGFGDFSEAFSKAGFEQGGYAWDETCFTFEDQCDCPEGSEWEEQFRRARQGVWASKEACLDECSAECVSDLGEARRLALEQAGELLRRLFGETGEPVFVEEPGGEEEGRRFCAAACGGICAGFAGAAAPGPRNGTRAAAPRAAAPGRGGAGPGAAAEAARGAAELLGAVLRRAGERIRGAAPLLLGAGGAAGAAGAALPAGGPGGNDLLWQGSQAAVNSPAASGSMPLAAKRWPPLDLVPLRTGLFQGLPESARWAEGSPRFLQRLLDKATRRLGLAAPGTVDAFR